MLDRMIGQVVRHIHVLAYAYDGSIDYTNGPVEIGYGEGSTASIVRFFVPSGAGCESVSWDEQCLKPLCIDNSAPGFEWVVRQASEQTVLVGSRITAIAKLFDELDVLAAVRLSFTTPKDLFVLNVGDAVSVSADIPFVPKRTEIVFASATPPPLPPAPRRA